MLFKKVNKTDEILVNSVSIVDEIFYICIKNFMKYIERVIKSDFLKRIKLGKVLLLLGARRVGKTFFLNTIQEELKEKFLRLNGEDIFTMDILSKRTRKNYADLIEDNKILIIDEAQKIPEIGNILKFIVDEFPKLKLIVTGSSMFDLKNKLGEPLTGRKYTMMLFPIAQMELRKIQSIVELKTSLPDRLIYGSYPEIFSIKTKQGKIEYLRELASDYLLKDILTIEGVRYSSQMLNLLKLLAYQVGSEVSYQELGKQLGISKNTVERYMDLLSKTFIIHRVSGFSRNLRNEVTKNIKWYFYDNGILNVFLNNFNALDRRQDVGKLWENFMVSERLKYQYYRRMNVNNYFWRTYTQQEIDWIEERNSKLYAYEFKWRLNKKVHIPTLWKENYSNNFKVIHSNNFLEFVS
ncbi:MAG: ATPase [Bacteroidia bacterium]|nr:MAG: ATPase [Bacteroidia bacterium]